MRLVSKSNPIMTSVCVQPCPTFQLLTRTMCYWNKITAAAVGVIGGKKMHRRKAFIFTASLTKPRVFVYGTKIWYTHTSSKINPDFVSNYKYVHKECKKYTHFLEISPLTDFI